MRGGARSIALSALFLGVAACGGARHRKVNGPPPEYELPDEPDAAYGGAAGAASAGSAGGNKEQGAATAPRSIPAGQGLDGGPPTGAGVR